ncbi:MAG: hypothetical protein GY828_06800 [Candidatus Gracilibacteria bacterium]|nr:hypothetical protein [Candidatus Gracilibacteria bacterium]
MNLDTRSDIEIDNTGEKPSQGGDQIVFLTQAENIHKINEGNNIKDQTENNLFDLKCSIVDNNKYSINHYAEKGDDIQEEFSKGNEILSRLNNTYIDNYIPKNIQITQQDLQNAGESEIFRKEVLGKVEKGLEIIATNMSSKIGSGMNMFGNSFGILDGTEIETQEAYIDFKNQLV